MDVFKLAVCQMQVTDNKKTNIAAAAGMLEAASKNRADIAVLPEMFNCPYDSSSFAKYAEDGETGETVEIVSRTARELDMYVIAGSIPENSGRKLYNTSYIFDRRGSIIGKHRKMHLFDIDVQGRIRFKESDTLSHGDEITVVDTEFCRVGVAICYDMRFPELMRLMALKGAKLLTVPAAFNMVTGPAHWELLIRTRALDNQVYVAAASPAKNENASYVAYGNSMVTDPWGSIVARAGYGSEIIYSDIDLARIDTVRNELPLLRHRRTDMYEIVEK